jgi:signal transduction histidine kinase
MFAMVEIKDNGMGIKEVEINNIFKRFYREKNDEDEDGGGISLYLLREIVSMQNGFVKIPRI